MKYIYYIALNNNCELVQGKIIVSEETEYAYKIKPIYAIKELQNRTVFNKRDDGSADWTTNPKNLGGILENTYKKQNKKLYTQINNLNKQHNNLTQTYNTLSQIYSTRVR